MFDNARKPEMAESCSSCSDKERLDPASLKALEDDIRQLAGHINIAMGQLLGLVERFDRARGWAHWGYSSCAAWLSATSGSSPRAATEQVRVARALAQRPQIKDALGCGELSFSKAAAISKIATDHNEADLVAIASQASPQDTEGMVRDYGRALRGAELEVINQRHASRYCRSGYDEDGWYLRARLCPEDGALVTKALEVTEKALRECDKGEERPSYETRTADALVAMAETALANDPKARQGADRYHILLHADIATLQGEQGVAELHEGPGLHPETLRRLACDASVTPVIERDGEPLNVGNKTRTIPARIDRALKARDRHCQFPGCRRTCLTERHHIRWVVRHGDNSIENLVVLCWHHHRLVHEGGFGVARENGVLVFRRPDGVPIREPTQATPKGPALVERHRAAGMAIDAETMPRWNGDTMDRDIAVHVLLQSDDLLRWPPLPKPGAESDGDEAGPGP